MAHMGDMSITCTGDTSITHGWHVNKTHRWHVNNTHGWQVNSTHRWHISNTHGWHVNNTQGWHINNTHGWHINYTHTGDMSITHMGDTSITHTHTGDTSITHTGDMSITHTGDTSITHTGDVNNTHRWHVNNTHGWHINNTHRWYVNNTHGWHVTSENSQFLERARLSSQKWETQKIGASTDISDLWFDPRPHKGHGGRSCLHEWYWPWNRRWPTSHWPVAVCGGQVRQDVPPLSSEWQVGGLHPPRGSGAAPSGRDWLRGYQAGASLEGALHNRGVLFVSNCRGNTGSQYYRGHTHHYQCNKFNTILVICLYYCY